MNFLHTQAVMEKANTKLQRCQCSGEGVHFLDFLFADDDRIANWNNQYLEYIMTKGKYMNCIWYNLFLLGKFKDDSHFLIKTGQCVIN